MGWFNNKLSGISGTKQTITEVQDITCLGFDHDFCLTYGRTIYAKILHECADRAMLPKEVVKSGYTMTVYDNYSPFKVGLVS